MTFPSDYKVVRFPGSTTGVLDVYNGFPRQVLIDTQTWTLRLMDGVTPGGYPVVHLRDFASIFVNNAIVEQGTRLSVEVADDAGTPELIAASAKVRPWSPLVIRSLFEKLANTATAGTWRILDAAMPDALKLAAQSIEDLDEAWYDGFYTVDPSSASNIPGSISTGTTRNLALIVSAQSTDNVMQMLVERDNSAKIWIRVRLDGAWQAWVLATGVTSSDLATKVSKAGDTMTGDLDFNGNDLRGLLTLNDGPLYAIDDCINGDFDIWQRAVSATASGYVAADRWTSENTGTTKTVSRQTNVLGDSSHGAKYFMRHLVASVAGAGNFCASEQRVENVLRWAGKRITVTFEAKADSSKDIAIEGRQNFGTGGSPSAAVDAINPQRITLGSAWAKYSLVFDFPSVTGKTLGTNGNDYSAVRFWFDAGTSFNARTVSLGQQNGTFDIRHVSFRIGDARKEADPKALRHITDEMELCQRYFQQNDVASPIYVQGYYGPSTTAALMLWFCPTMRVAPTIVTTHVNAGNFNAGAATLQESSRTHARVTKVSNNSSPANGFYGINYTADAEL